MKKQDFLLIGSMLGLAVLLLAGYLLFFQKPGSYAEITIDGTVYQTLPLNQNTTLQIPSGDGHSNQLEITDGFAKITDADCPDQLCVHQKKISHQGETLVCLPHKVVVTIRSQNKIEEDVPDSISH